MDYLDESSAGLTPEAFHENEILQLHTSQFSFGQYYPIGNVRGETKLAQYDLGQGWIGNNIEKNDQTVANGTNHRDFVINNINLRQEDFGKPQLEIQLVGFGNVLHNATIYIGPSLDDLRVIRDNLTFNYTSFVTEDQQIQWEDVSSEGRLFIRVEEVGYEEFARDVIFASYIKLTFPQEIDVQSQSGVYFHMDKVDLGLAHLEIDNVVANQRVYDLTEPKHPIRVNSTSVIDNKVSAVVDMTTRYRTFYTENETDFVNAKVERITFKPSKPEQRELLHSFTSIPGTSRWRL